MEGLKPCPFCGGKAKHTPELRHHIGRDSNFMHVIMCGWCNARSGWYDTYEEAAAAWNDRTERMYPRQNGKSTRAVDEALEEMGYVRERPCRMEQRAWPGDSATLYICSECGGWTYTEDAPRYCAFCGAKVVDE